MTPHQTFPFCPGRCCAARLFSLFLLDGWTAAGISHFSFHIRIVICRPKCLLASLLPRRINGRGAFGSLEPHVGHLCTKIQPIHCDAAFLFCLHICESCEGNFFSQRILFPDQPDADQLIGHLFDPHPLPPVGTKLGVVVVSPMLMTPGGF